MKHYEVKMITKTVEEWKLNHIESADDLCILAPTMKAAEEMLADADTNADTKFDMEIGR